MNSVVLAAIRIIVITIVMIARILLPIRTSNNIKNMINQAKLLMVAIII